MKHFLSLSLILFSITIFAQQELKYSSKEPNRKNKELTNDDYNKYGYKTGYRKRNVGFDNFSKYRLKGGIPKTLGSFPSRYDLRETPYLTKPKNQGQCGSCWTFAVAGSLESRLLKINKALYNGIDVSENNIKECHKYFWSACNGGNTTLTTSYITSGLGPVLESDDKYIDSEVGCKSGLKPFINIFDFYFQYGYEDYIKQALLDYGALSTDYYSDDNFYNEDDYTYYYDGSIYDAEQNHAVLIVGWDDSKVTKGGIGAWIIKNSWSESWGENGFFYISYNDPLACLSFSYVDNISPYKEGLKIYQYDEVGLVSSVGFDDDNYALVKYVAEDTITINGIGSWLMSVGNMKASIYSSFNGTKLSNLLASSERTVDSEGFFTIGIDNLRINKGEAFYVKMEYNTNGYIYNIPIEEYESGFSSPTIETGKYWVSDNGSNGSWQSVGANNVNKFDICIKVFAQTKDSITINFMADQTDIYVDDTVTYANLSSGASVYTWEFTGTNPSKIINNGESVKAVYNASGTYSAKLIGRNESGEKDSVLKTNYINVTENTCYNSIKTEYHNSFEVGVDNLSGWQVMDINQDNVRWSLFNSNQYAHTGNYSIYYYNEDPNVYPDDYLMSNCFYFRKDVNYDLSFYYRGYDNSLRENLAVLLFDENLNLVEILKDNYNFAAGSYTLENIPIKVNSSDNYRIVFYIYGDYGAHLIFLDDLNIKVNCTNVLVNAGTDKTICKGDSVVLNGTGNGVLAWNDTIGSNQITVKPELTTKYILKVENAGCIKYDTVIVNVNPLPTVGINSNSTAICEGQVLDLKATGAKTYTWENNIVKDTISVSPTITTVYNVTGKDVNGCTNTASINIAVNKSEITLTANPKIVDKGSSSLLIAKGGNTYSWNFSTNENDSQYVTPIVSTQYSVTGTDGNGCTASNYAYVSVNDSVCPMVYNTTEMGVNATSAVLKWENVTNAYYYLIRYRIKGGNWMYIQRDISKSMVQIGCGVCNDIDKLKPNTTYEWQMRTFCDPNGKKWSIFTEIDTFKTQNVNARIGGAKSICKGESVMLYTNNNVNVLWSNGATLPSIIVSPIITTTYTLTISNNGVSATNEAVVIVNDNITMDLGSDRSICSGDTSILIANGALNYKWNTGSLNDSIVVKPNTTTTYIVTGIKNTCSGIDTIVVNVTQSPYANAGADVIICRGDTATLNSTGGSNYLWNNGQTNSIIKVAPTETTTYYLTVSNQSCVKTDAAVVVVNSVNAYAGEDTTICSGQVATLYADGGNNYIWSNGSKMQTINVRPTNTTEYIVTVSNNLCSSKDTVRVVIDNKISAYINNHTSDTSLCNGNRITLKAFPDSGSSYRWNTGSLRQTITAKPQIDTKYIVTVTKDNCSNVAYVNVTVVNCKEENEIDNFKSNDKEQAITIYPNPIYEGTANLIIKGFEDELLNVIITNNIGVTIINTTLTPNNDNFTHKLSLGDYVAGMYFVTIRSKSENKTMKVIIE